MQFILHIYFRTIVSQSWINKQSYEESFIYFLNYLLLIFIYYNLFYLKPCPESTDFRAAQCSAYNNRPYRGRFYKWLPFHDPEDPCVLACQAEGFGFVAKHSKKVHDGTRCREGALDMCVDGNCQVRERLTLSTQNWLHALIHLDWNFMYIKNNVMGFL